MKLKVYICMKYGIFNVLQSDAATDVNRYAALFLLTSAFLLATAFLLGTTTSHIQHLLSGIKIRQIATPS